MQLFTHDKSSGIRYGADVHHNLKSAIDLAPKGYSLTLTARGGGWDAKLQREILNNAIGDAYTGSGGDPVAAVSAAKGAIPKGWFL